MKRAYTLIFAGGLALILAYSFLPEVARYILKPAELKHVDINASRVAAIHIATSDPHISLMVFENDGIVSVDIFRELANGDFLGAQAWVSHSKPEIEVSLTRKDQGIVTAFMKSDEAGIPTRKVIREGTTFKSYSRGTLDWKESGASEKRPNQTPEPTPPSRRGSP